jgi:ABC-type bacteriocin/lantibiotic exporter with double-glycine peptidase domain
MAKTTIKQHDITDCGAACLASISSHFNLQIPIARIQQYKGTDKKGTNVLSFLIRIVKGLSLRITFFPVMWPSHFLKTNVIGTANFHNQKKVLI